MKILFHHRTLSKDGMDVHISELVAAFRRQGHDVLVVGPRAEANNDFGSGGGLMSYIRRLLPSALSELVELSYSVVAYRRLKRAYQTYRPDLVYERYNLHLLAGSELKARTNCPLIVEVNAPLVTERQAFGTLRLTRLAAWSEARVWRAADYVLPVTSRLAEIVSERDVPADRIRVVSNGVNLERFRQGVDSKSIRERYNLQSSVVLGFVGFVRPWHGMDRIIDIIAKWQGEQPLSLLLVGDGPSRQDLEDQARSLGVRDRVVFTGVIPRDDIADHIAAFDVALQPRAVDYASPLKLFEYMALGRAIIAPDQANIKEVLCHDRDALLFNPDRPEDLEGSIIALVEDAPLRQRLGEAAARAIRDRNLTWDANAATIVGFARKIMSNRTAL